MENFYVVAIGTSSGGIPVLIDVLERLPGYNHAAFIIIMHLLADKKSNLPRALAYYTSMKVYRAHENQLIEPNNVYVIPENQMMTIVNGHLKLKERTIE